MKQCKICSKSFDEPTKKHYCDSCKEETRKQIQRKSHVSTRKGIRLSDLSPEEREAKRLAQRGRHLKSKYGISLSQYEEMMRQQNDCCGVCGKHKSQEKKNFHVDHDHHTGEIRGLLCNYCNRRVIGRLRDPNLFRKAAEYLDKGTGLFVPKKYQTAKRKPSRG